MINFRLCYERLLATGHTLYLLFNSFLFNSLSFLVVIFLTGLQISVVPSFLLLLASFTTLVQYGLHGSF